MKNKTILKTLLASPLLALSITIALPTETIAQQKPQANKVFTYVDQMPQYKGGEKELVTFIASNINYPADAKANGVEGLVVVSFVVDENGKLKDSKVLKKLGRGTDEEALRVINLTSGNWTPGSQNGKVVPVQYTLPIRFTLSESERAATADVANQVPQFKGGAEALHSTLAKHMQLPAEAKQENLNARIVARFYVEQDGTVSNIRLEETKLKKTVGAGADMDYMDAATFQVQNKAVLARLAEAATTAIRATSGKWQPALKNGQPVGSELVLPLHFTANPENAKAIGTPQMTKLTKGTYTYDEAHVKPVFKEGTVEKFLVKNLRYPSGTEFEGIIETGIIIKEDGSFTGPMIYFDPKNPEKNKEIGNELFKELNRVFKLMEGKWEPAKVDGKPVTVTRKITLKFVTNNGASKTADASEVKPDVIVTRYK